MQCANLTTMMAQADAWLSEGLSFVEKLGHDVGACAKVLPHVEEMQSELVKCHETIRMMRAFPAGGSAGADLQDDVRRAQQAAFAARAPTAAAAPGGFQHFHVGGDDGEQLQNGKYIFDDKIARDPAWQYKASDKLKWSVMTRNYLVSKCPDARAFLKWIEDRQHAEISEEDIRESSAMMNVDPIVLSQNIWGYLNLNLQADPEAMVSRQPR